MKLFLLTLLIGSSSYASDFLSFKKDIKPVFSKNCVQCHSNKSPLPHLLDYNVAFEYRFQIRSRMVDRTMPHFGFLRESDRDLIKDWVDQGAKK